jgi:tight adherence protein B
MACAERAAGPMTGGAITVVCGLVAGAGVLVIPPAPRRQGSRTAGRLRTGKALRTTWRSLNRRRRRHVTISAASVLRLVDDLATQVRAGAAPVRAWTVATSLLTEWGDGSGGARLEVGGEAPRECLDRLAAAGDAPAGLVALRSAWVLCEDVGAPLADVLASVADAMRQDAEVEADIESALAAPRSTARLLALLPMAGLALGELVGARPVHVLLHSSVGRLCAVAGLALALAGHWWARRLVEHTAARL